jgi:hypothetical protein
LQNQSSESLPENLDIQRSFSQVGLKSGKGKRETGLVAKQIEGVVGGRKQKKE